MKTSHVWKLNFSIEILNMGPIPSITDYEKVIITDNYDLSVSEKYLKSCIEGTNHIMKCYTIEYVGEAEWIGEDDV